jgi:hypothetical protein
LEGTEEAGGVGCGGRRAMMGFAPARTTGEGGAGRGGAGRGGVGGGGGLGGGRHAMMGLAGWGGRLGSGSFDGPLRLDPAGFARARARGWICAARRAVGRQRRGLRAPVYHQRRGLRRAPRRASGPSHRRSGGLREAPRQGDGLWRLSAALPRAHPPNARTCGRPHGDLGPTTKGPKHVIMYMQRYQWNAWAPWWWWSECARACTGISGRMRARMPHARASARMGGICMENNNTPAFVDDFSFTEIINQGR